MPEQPMVQDLLDFIQRSPTPFHAVQNMQTALQRSGFVFLAEGDHWPLERGGRYVVTRNDSSIIAFCIGQSLPADYGFRMVGAHTDSPCLKIKPKPDKYQQSCYQLGVETYGGVLLNPWFDRDLSMAGRVTYLDKNSIVRSALIDFRRAVATIPSLAIHLDREANEKRSINKQTDLPPVLATGISKDQIELLGLLEKQLGHEHPKINLQKILDYEISLYDTQSPAVLGINEDFIAAARLDNLLSCFVATQTILNWDGRANILMVCSDHEEVGSASHSGAQGTFLSSVLERICGSGADYHRAMDASVLVSADNAHAVHPNYADRHDGNHGPVINVGPVIKINANQRYATNSETGGLFRHICDQANVPVQAFVVRSDMACGSTIGPITATGIGIRTLDVGVPTFAMHSIRELAGTKDVEYLFKALTGFVNYEKTSLFE